MTDQPLSPAAQGVLDAFENASDGEYVEGVWVVNERTMLSAALRAAANDWRVDVEFIDGVEYIRTSTLERIAAELDNTSPPSK
jgi:hypothetical protein